MRSSKCLARSLATGVILLVFVSCSWAGRPYSDDRAGPSAAILKWPAGLPVYDHIVIVMEENKDYEEVIGKSYAPYINNVLKKEGANFTRMYGEEHFSQGNYFWMFSGDNHNIGFTDEIPSEKNPLYPFKPSLGERLINKRLSFKGYAEDLPTIGFTGDRAGNYVRKHVPWISFANVPKGTTVATSSDLRFADFPSPGHYETLPRVAFVIPNLINDMHDPRDIKKSIPAGDKWLRDNIGPYYQWAKYHNSLLILTFDENDDKRLYQGLTNPFVDPEKCTGKGRDREYCVDLQNRIVTIFAGAHIEPGDYPEGKGITHVNILRTIEAMYGLSKSGHQQPNAAGGGITDNYIVTDVFEIGK
ncbi:MAG: alkaline phosphatase family protein [Desulfobaccales bacterium]